MQLRRGQLLARAPRALRRRDLAGLADLLEGAEVLPDLVAPPGHVHAGDRAAIALRPLEADEAGLEVAPELAPGPLDLLEAPVDRERLEAAPDPWPRGDDAGSPVAVVAAAA